MVTVYKGTIYSNWHYITAMYKYSKDEGTYQQDKSLEKSSGNVCRIFNCYGQVTAHYYVGACMKIYTQKYTGIVAAVV